MFPHPLCAREEERRLFYVAMTRAKDALTMSYCASRASRKPSASARHPSPFLFETQSLEG
jgi:superfamily I DNA/RNA helicase